MFYLLYFYFYLAAATGAAAAAAAAAAVWRVVSCGDAAARGKTKRVRQTKSSGLRRGRVVVWWLHNEVKYVTKLARVPSFKSKKT